jgi:hypothetical protein
MLAKADWNVIEPLLSIMSLVPIKFMPTPLD